MHALPNCADADALEATLRQIRVMRCYATESGKPINEDLAAALARLAALRRKGDKSAGPKEDKVAGEADGEAGVPGEPNAEQAAEEQGDTAQDQPNDYEAAYRLALEAHRQLAALVHPANPATIVSTEFSWNPKRFKRLQAFLIAIVVLTAGAMCFFAYASYEINTRHTTDVTKETSDPTDSDAEVPLTPPPTAAAPLTKPGAPPTNEGTGGDPSPKEAAAAGADAAIDSIDDEKDEATGGPTAAKDKGQAEARDRERNWWLSIQIFAAAMLGAGFATLLNAAPFVVQRSFNNSYITFYLIRYFVGIIAGVILGFIGPELAEGFAQLSAAVLAIVGGFSANAVAAILTRISETLVALVRGRNDAPKEEVDRQINERVEAERQRFNATQATKISAILAEFDQDPNKAREALRAMLGKPPGA